MSLLRILFESFLGPADRLLAALPLESARVAAIALLSIPPLVCLFASRRWIYRGASDTSGWRDLRWWAVAFTLPYLVVYWLA